MTTIICDICKKPIDDAHHEQNYETVRFYDVCSPCMKQFLRDLEDNIENRRPYSIEMQQKELWKRLEAATK